jgi:hypothetical protein
MPPRPAPRPRCSTRRPAAGSRHGRRGAAAGTLRPGDMTPRATAQQPRAAPPPAPPRVSTVMREARAVPRARRPAARGRAAPAHPFWREPRTRETTHHYFERTALAAAAGDWADLLGLWRGVLCRRAALCRAPLCVIPRPDRSARRRIPASPSRLSTSAGARLRQRALQHRLHTRAARHRATARRPRAVLRDQRAEWP